MELFTNTTKHSDYLLNMFLKHGKNCDVYIASPFFTRKETIEDLSKNGCKVYLIVRLCETTSPVALKSVIALPNVFVRFYTSRTFHPKIYIFGNKVASVGSSNLTEGGLVSNQEVNLVVNSDNPIFSQIRDSFEDYWEYAKALDSGSLSQYEEIKSRYSAISTEEHKLHKEINEAFGDIEFPNIKRGKKKPKASSIFLDNYRKDYQFFINAFNIIRGVYEDMGKRKVNSETLPLHIEIDQLFNWVRETKASGDTYKSTPLLNNDELKEKIRVSIDEFMNADWKYLQTITDEKYPRIVKTLGDEDSIQKASTKELVEALLINHAFHDCFRFHEGGLETLKRVFVEDNGEEKIKNTLIYLLHDQSDEFITRMGNCIFNDKYKLKHFGDSCVQETLGWVNEGNVPICNNRTLKSIRWFGFNISA